MNFSDSYKPAIVIPAYRRPDHLLRLLESVNRATYPSDNIPVVLSVDGGADPSVLNIANTYQFKQCSKKVIVRKDNLGLRSHILTLGDLTQKYGSIILLEDDLIVSPAYYMYAQHALDTYAEESKVAGISLYSHRYNETAQLPFEPLQTVFDACFMQMASSWGQAWSLKQWESFRSWYKPFHDKPFPVNDNLPQNVKEWPESSWKKYFNLYLVQNQRWFVYPYSSYTTGGTDFDAQHMNGAGTLFQVPLNMADRLKEGFLLPGLNDPVPFYDAYMEVNPGKFNDWLDAADSDIEMDLYGTKPAELLKRKKYTITPRNIEQAVQQFPLTYKPLELNLMHQVIEGEKPFYSLVLTEQIKEHSDSNSEWLINLAHHLSGINMSTRKFAKGYFKYIFIKKLFNVSTKVK